MLQGLQHRRSMWVVRVLSLERPRHRLRRLPVAQPQRHAQQALQPHVSAYDRLKDGLDQPYIRSSRGTVPLSLPQRHNQQTLQPHASITCQTLAGPSQGSGSVEP